MIVIQILDELGEWSSFTLLLKGYLSPKKLREKSHAGTNIQKVKEKTTQNITKCPSRVKMTVVAKNRNVSKIGSRFICLPTKYMTFIYTEQEMKKSRILERYINKVVDIIECSQLLGCSERTFYRRLKDYKEKGPPGLIHGLKGKPSNHSGDNTKYGTIKSIVTKKVYQGFGPTLMKEHLERDYHIIINKETLRQIMIRSGVWFARRSNKKIERQQRARETTEGKRDNRGQENQHMGGGANLMAVIMID